MWLVFSGISACLTGIVALAVKYARTGISSISALLIRSFTVLTFSSVALIFERSSAQARGISSKALLFTVLSGGALCLSFLAFYRAMESASVGKVASLERFSSPVTVVLGFILLNEKVNALKIVSLVLIVLGILISLYEKKEENAKGKERGILFYGASCALMGGFSVILSKLAMGECSPMSALTVRTLVATLITTIIVGKKNGFDDLLTASPKELLFALAVGVGAAMAWMCSFSALDLASAALVQPVEKLGIWVSVLGGAFLFNEKLKASRIVGLAVMSVGILIPVFYEMRKIWLGSKIRVIIQNYVFAYILMRIEPQGYFITSSILIYIGSL